MADVKIVIGGDASGAAAALKQAQTGLQAVGTAGQVSVAQTANAMRMLPAQLTDVVTQLAGGQSPFLVLIQQGGQVKDMFGGIGPTFAALAGAMNPVMVVIGALAAVVGTAALALYEGATQSSAFQRSLVLTGNFAAQTAASTDAMARGFAASGQVTIGTARELTAALVASGQYGPQAIGAVGAAMATLQSISGRSSDEIVGAFASMSRGVAAWAAESNRQYHFLSEAQFRHIKLLEDQGRTEQAMVEASKALKAELDGRRVQLGYLAEAWMSLKNGASAAWDAMLGVGKPKTLQDQIAAAQRDIAAAQKSLATGKGANPSGVDIADTRATQAFLAQKQQQLEYLREQERLETRVADKKAADAAKAQKAINDSQSGAADRLENSVADKKIAYVRTASAAELAELDARQVAAEAAYKLGMSTLEQYEQQRIDIIIKARDERVAELRFEIAQEGKRPGDRAEDMAAKAVKVAQLQGQITAAMSAAQKDEATARRAIDEGKVQDARANAQAWADAWIKADERVKQLASDTATARIALIQDPDARARAESGQQIAQLRRQRDGEGRDLQNRIDIARGSGDGEQANGLQQQMDKVFEGYADRIGAINDTLSQRLKPGWQKMVEGWKDTNALMRDSYATMMDGVVRNGEAAFVQLVTTGKLNTQSLVAGVLEEFAKLQYRKLVANLGGVFDNLLGSAISFFSGGSSLSGGRAEGGSVLPGGLYLVGERGPELLKMGGSGGQVLPNHALGAMAGGGAQPVQITLAPTIHIDARSDQAQVAQLVGGALANERRSMWDELRARGVVR